KSILARGACRRSYELAVDVIKLAAVDPDLDKARAPRLTGFGDPSFGELFGCFRLCERRDKLVVPCAVQTGVRPDLEADSVRETFQQFRIAAKKIRGAIMDSLTSELFDFFQLGASDAKHLVSIVPSGPDLVCPDEIDENV